MQVSNGLASHKVFGHFQQKFSFPIPHYDVQERVFCKRRFGECGPKNLTSSNPDYFEVVFACGF